MGRWIPAGSISSSSSSARPPLPSYTRAAVAGHCTPRDAWVIIGAAVYDVSRLAGSHPGGRLPLEHLAGRDATDAFEANHPGRVQKGAALAALAIGRLDAADAGTSALVAGFRALRQELIASGAYETATSYYVGQAVWLGTLLASAIALSTLGASTWARLAGAVVLGLFWQQLAFIGARAVACVCVGGGGGGGARVDGAISVVELVFARLTTM